MRTLLAILAVFSTNVFARSAYLPFDAPAQKAPAAAPVTVKEQRKVAAYRQASNSYYSSRQETPSKFKFGLEGGFLGRKNSSEGKALGMQWMTGGRFVMDYAWRYRWHIRPTLGYYHRSQGENSSSVSEHNFELGASILYNLFPNRRSSVMVGIANRIDGLISSITILDSTETIPLTFRYRMGPQISGNIYVARNTYITVNFEAPMEIPDFRIFGSAGLGVLTRF